MTTVSPARSTRHSFRSKTAPDSRASLSPTSASAKPAFNGVRKQRLCLPFFCQGIGSHSRVLECRDLRLDPELHRGKLRGHRDSPLGLSQRLLEARAETGLPGVTGGPEHPASRKCHHGCGLPRSVPRARIPHRNDVGLVLSAPRSSAARQSPQCDLLGLACWHGGCDHWEGAPLRYHSYSPGSCTPPRLEG